VFLDPRTVARNAIHARRERRYEAIRNASVHSSASKLEIELTYGQNFSLRMANNGAGIDPAVDRSGEARTLRAARNDERAGRIGGTFTLTSSSDAGTEVKLVVSGKIIFRTQKSLRQTLLTKLRSFARRTIQKPTLD
jgi:signal transduction histidine kinase